MLNLSSALIIPNTLGKMLVHSHEMILYKFNEGSREAHMADKLVKFVIQMDEIITMSLGLELYESLIMQKRLLMEEFMGFANAYFVDLRAVVVLK
ncbi:hypothetical protein WA026_022807 [Henosepilachna vigintioctopunctata]|uniref:Uncharacterized protein n=1 Tax=Henosepilachna vigintioctopunctata TaxID=420089 RepID=A0AAW1VJK8_9CUCU